MKGLIHIYCGDGKGKSTAGVGMAIRAAGAGMKVIMSQFMKTGTSSELEVLKGISGIHYIPCNQSFGFAWNMNAEQAQEASSFYSSFFEEITKATLEEDADMLIMDEFMSAYNYGFLDKEEALTFLKTKPEKLEIILTGRDPEPELIELASYVSEVKKIKHPYDEGMIARKGIEM